MSAVAAPTMTADEFFDWVNRPENRGRRFELERGETIEMPPAGDRHGATCGNVVGILWSYTRQIGKGRVNANDAGIVIERDPDSVRGPDVALYFDDKAFEDLANKYSDDMPALVVEVMSPTDRMGKMLKRMDRFLDKGVALGWLVDPEGQTVSVHRPNQKPVVLEANEELAGFAELPNFRCKVAEFFLILR